MRNYLGCSGFMYDHWKGNFYPEEHPKKKWLEFYTQHFDTVEINSSFYHMPKQKTLENWYDRTPGNFRFTLKGSRFITHQKKLNDVGEPVKTFYDLAAHLRGKLGCILWQLPGNQHQDIEKLKTFCKVLSPEFENVIEFRHNSWFEDTVYAVLKEHSISLCIISAPDGLKEEFVKTSDLVYARFHGKAQWYRYNYNNNELQTWAEQVNELHASEVYAYFNNDYDAFAIKNAKQLSGFLNKK